jgi:biopolymer transport protein ExbD
MAFGSGLSDSEDELSAEINTTPLVDVMLVLLIIFIITVPVLNHAVKIDLPRATSQPNDAKPRTITLTIDAAGQIYWNEAAMVQSDLAARFAEAAAQDPQPELHLRADRNTRYETVAEVMSAAQVAGLNRIGFITEPKR